MDKHTEIAQEFHKLFEGKDLYPKFVSWQWIAWLVLGPIFAISAGYAAYCIATQQPALKVVLSGIGMIVAELAFLSVNAAIDSYKNKRQDERFSLKPPDVKLQLQAAKRRELERLFGLRSASFLTVAKEMSELKAAKKDFAEPSIGFWSSIFQSDAKPRLIAITLGACAITAALINRSIESTAIFELIESGNFYVILSLCVWLALIAHFSIYGGRVAFQAISGKVMEWLLRLGWSKTANKIALNYMAQALVELHEPAKTIQRPLKPFDSYRRRRAKLY
ncbi:hypothetical protein DJFAAGMI_01435 [Comamonas sp. PE63]|uniref:DUF4231 domain-containing protein n=1 Tax=Comamonas brasiliensis TaxID=1812482 RepID=A0ABS5LQE2_9BURK|nr:hypothetical protein [Comamonas sp. PE63]MBS3018703.1 hypothetical protein [Comamonas sp. PE63]